MFWVWGLSVRKSLWWCTPRCSGSRRDVQVRLGWRSNYPILALDLGRWRSEQLIGSLVHIGIDMRWDAFQKSPLLLSTLMRSNVILIKYNNEGLPLHIPKIQSQSIFLHSYLLNWPLLLMHPGQGSAGQRPRYLKMDHLPLYCTSRHSGATKHQQSHNHQSGRLFSQVTTVSSKRSYEVRDIISCCIIYLIGLSTTIRKLGWHSFQDGLKPTTSHCLLVFTYCAISTA